MHQNLARYLYLLCVFDESCRLFDHPSFIRFLGRRRYKATKPAVKRLFSNAAHVERSIDLVSNSAIPCIICLSENGLSENFQFQGQHGELKNRAARLRKPWKSLGLFSFLVLREKRGLSDVSKGVLTLSVAC